MKITPLLLLLPLSSIVCAASPTALPLLVTPPTSAGTNEGYSRMPAPATFYKKENILVTENIGATKRHSPHGNNSQFHITEYYISPDGKSMQISSWSVFEGTSKLANEESFELTCIAPYTFLFDLGEGNYRTYHARFAQDGELELLQVTDNGESSKPYTIYQIESELSTQKS